MDGDQHRTEREIRRSEGKRESPCPVLVVPAGRAPDGRTASDPDVHGDPHAQRCIVCANPTTELICEPCRARLRGEALERKLEDERAGRR